MSAPLNATKAAKLLGVSVPTVISEINKGTVPGAYKFGGQYLIPLETIEAIKDGSLLFGRNTERRAV